METVLVILGLLGAARGLPQHPQPVQHFYNPQTGQHYIYYQGNMYEQNIPQNPGSQGYPTQNVATPNWTPQPPNGQWYPQQQTQTAANPQGYYR
jgi:hypothetical protein